MATPIKMPDLGTTVEVVTLIAWLKQEGEPVKRGEALCEVETDKAVDQLESVAAGVLLRQVVPARSEVRSGTVIAYIGSPGEVIPAESAASCGAAVPAAQAGETPAPQMMRKVPPVIRNLAKREGVDLDVVVGTGPGGQITRDDVLRAKQTGMGSPAASLSRNVAQPPSAVQSRPGQPGAAVPQTSVGTGTKSGVPYSKEQRSVARRVARSNREIPTVDMTASIDMSAVIRARQKLREEHSRKFAFDGFFLFAVARSIEKFPSFAAHADDELLHKHETIDVCVAVSHEKKLYLPAIRNVNKLTLDEIQSEIERIIKKIRDGQLSSSELAGGCFTVSNLGMYPIDSFQMIIPPDQSAALAIGATQQRPVVKDGQIIARPVCTVALAVDHRMINGAEAAEFLKHLKETLEQL